MASITYTCRPATPEETQHTVAQLKAHTEAAIGAEVSFEPFAVMAYEGETLIGSIIGKIFSNWLHLELVFVEPSHRHKGIGRQLLAECIARAKSSGLSGIEVWTQSWQAPEFYRHCGFKEFAVLEDFIPGKKRHVLQYRFSGEAL